MMTNTGPINTFDDVATRPFNLSELAEMQNDWTNKKEA